MSPVRATPFHVRAADANSGNLWSARRGFTLAAAYSGAEAEAAAARIGVVMADISWRWRGGRGSPPHWRRPDAAR